MLNWVQSECLIQFCYLKHKLTHTHTGIVCVRYLKLRFEKLGRLWETRKKTPKFGLYINFFIFYRLNVCTPSTLFTSSDIRSRTTHHNRGLPQKSHFSYDYSDKRCFDVLYNVFFMCIVITVSENLARPLDFIHRTLRYVLNVECVMSHVLVSYQFFSCLSNLNTIKTHTHFQSEFKWNGKSCACTNESRQHHQTWKYTKH